MTSKHYREIFRAFEETLLIEGGKNLPRDQIQAELDRYKQVTARQDSDANCYRQLVAVVFYSGMRAATVTDRLPTIYRHFPDHRTVLEYGEDQIQEILADPRMLRNERKIRSCVGNADIFDELVTKHGSFRNYLHSFHPNDSLEGVLSLKEDLQGRFGGLGPITSYHLMSELGLPVQKPDRVIMRIFSRLGLILNEEASLAAVRVGREIAEATGHPVRYIDIVMVACGQVASPDFGIDRGVCLKKPECGRCHATEFCRYFRGGPHPSDRFQM